MSQDFGTFAPPAPEPRGPAPAIEQLDDEAREFLAESLEVARALGLPESMQELSGIFAERRSQWFDTPPAERPDPNDFVSAVSVLVGQRLAQALGVDWVLYTDTDGASLALLVPAERLREGQNLYIFPLDGVAARWPDDAEGEVLDYYDGVVGYVRNQFVD